MLFEGPKTYGTTKRGNELSKTKNRGLVGWMRVTDITMYRRPQPRLHR